MEQFKLPAEWDLSISEEIVIGILMGADGGYVSPSELCSDLYEEEIEGAAPAKLRGLVSRCRDRVYDISEGRVEIEGKRIRGWRISKEDTQYLLSLV